MKLLRFFVGICIDMNLKIQLRLRYGQTNKRGNAGS
jgi:hypothetical protein